MNRTIKSGIKPTRADHRDYDHHKSFGFSVPPSFPEHLSVDAELWNPDQNEGSNLFTPPVPSLPYGCTGYGTTDSRIDEDGVLRNPMEMEIVTHANARGGIDMREALKAAVKIFGYSAYFNIRAAAPLDWFDAVRLSILSTSNEKRCAILGTPFYPEFLMTGIDGITAMPSDWSLSRASWHCWNVKGWSTIGGVPYLICKPWIGRYVLMPREIFNPLMNISGSCAFTLSKTVPANVQTVDLGIVQAIVSYIRNLLRL